MTVDDYQNRATRTYFFWVGADKVGEVTFERGTRGMPYVPSFVWGQAQAFADQHKRQCIVTDKTGIRHLQQADGPVMRTFDPK